MCSQLAFGMLGVVQRNQTRLGRLKALAFSVEKIPDVIEKIIAIYSDYRESAPLDLCLYRASLSWPAIGLTVIDLNKC